MILGYRDLFVWLVLAALSGMCEETSIEDNSECTYMLYVHYHFIKIFVLPRYYIPTYFTRYTDPLDLSKVTWIDFQ